MTVEQRLRHLEAKLSDLEAVVDGSEEQTRKAAIYLVGLVTRFLHEKRLIDEAALREYLRSFEGRAVDDDDYMGELVFRFGGMLDLHQRYPEDFDLSGRRSEGDIQHAVPGRHGSET